MDTAPESQTPDSGVIKHKQSTTASNQAIETSAAYRVCYISALILTLVPLLLIKIINIETPDFFFINIVILLLIQLTLFWKVARLAIAGIATVMLLTVYLPFMGEMPFTMIFSAISAITFYLFWAKEVLPAKYLVLLLSVLLTSFTVYFAVLHLFL